MSNWHSLMGLTNNSELSCRIEQSVQFRQGYAEVREYRWPHNVETAITMSKDLLVLNMALTPRPTQTRIASLEQPNPNQAVDAGRLMLIMPGSHFHLSAPSGQLRSLHCALKLSRIEEILGECPDWQEADSIIEQSGSCREIEWLLNRIYQEFRYVKLGTEAVTEAYANALSVELARCIKESKLAGQKKFKGGLAPWRMKLLRERIQREDIPPPALAELAELCSMTIRHLSRAFKDETGNTLGQFIQEVTIDRATCLLIETNRPIAQIANELGFSSGASFSQAYQRSAGILPSRVRNR